MKEIIYKILLLGNNDSGKTNFISRYIDNTYNPMLLSTIGLDFKIKRITLNDGITAKIQIWDTASGERYNHITRTYLKGANGFIIMYNMTKRKFFENAAYWLKEIRDCTNNNNIILVGNHMDSDYSTDYYHKRVISTEEGQKFAEDNNLLFL